MPISSKHKELSNGAEQRELFESTSKHLGRTMAKLIRQSQASSDPEETTYKTDDIAADLAQRLYNDGWRKRAI
jgi:hypothetical protein